MRIQTRRPKSNEGKYMDNQKLEFYLLTETATVPMYAHEGDSGMDVCADDDVEIRPYCTAKVSTGIAAVIPDGHELQVRPRSGLSSRGVIAAFGTVDTGYRGEIGVVLYNFTEGIVWIRKGDRIAQLVLAPVTRVEITAMRGDPPKNTERGTAGFGSTGVSSAKEGM